MRHATTLCALSLLLASSLLAACGAAVGPSDGGASSDTALTPDAPGCALGNGTICPVGASCLAPDGCNHCSCSASGVSACTELACVPVDAGAPVDSGGRADSSLPAGRCFSSQDCAAGREECRFVLGGCGGQGYCSALTDCAAMQPFCSCTGTTFLDCDVTRTTRPAVGRGACELPPVDAGGARD